MSDPIRISDDELQSAKVDEALAAEAAYRGAWTAEGGSDGGGAAVGKVKRHGGAPGRGRGSGIYLGGVIITALLGLAGALAGWAVFEPFFDDIEPRTQQEALRQGLIGFLMIPCIAFGAAAGVGAADGLLSRAPLRTLQSAGLSALVAGAVGLFSSCFANIAYSMAIKLVVSLVGDATISRLQAGETPFVAIVGIMICRSMAWTLFGCTIGLGPGIYQRSRDLIMVGVLGGVLGGFLGGLCFDPIGVVTASGADSEAWVSRAVGFGFVGLVTGLAIGLVEQLSKDAWLFMEEGPLAGKQFVLYKDPTRVGSSPKNDVYLFKDSEIAPEHALLRRAGSTHEVEALGDATVLVNGRRVSRERLEDGDEVRIGRARFRYYVRAQRREVKA